MGFFSWLTADTNESIRNRYTGEHLTVYLLQPGNQPPIREDAYEGYGVFGGVDAHDWLARQNLSAEKLAGLSDEQVRMLGVSLGCGNYYVDSVTGRKISIFHWGGDIIDPEIAYYPVSYEQPLADFDGKKPNELIAEGRLVATPYPCDRPLKFSFHPNARYEDLPASKDCPDQGYFDADEDEDEGCLDEY